MSVLGLCLLIHSRGTLDPSITGTVLSQRSRLSVLLTILALAGYYLA